MAPPLLLPLMLMLLRGLADAAPEAVPAVPWDSHQQAVDGTLGVPLPLPEGFLMGTATAAYQIEGGWNSSGKGPSVWDDYLHREPWRVVGEANGDVACDSLRLYRRDIQMIKEMGLDTYRISLSWPRILPDGTLLKVNQAGVKYYNAVIDELIKHGIQPIVTLFHWDLPLPLQHLGGWSNPAIVDYFEDYARFAIAAFGDRVKLWVTVNEPYQVCEFGYSDVIMAPFYNFTGVAGYLCTHYMLLGHARVYRMYKRDFASQKGRMGLAIHAYWFEPANPDDKRDHAAAERGMEFNLGWTAHPVFVGDYPPIMRSMVDRASAEEGLLRSRLPRFTRAEIDEIKGSADFLGVNHYQSLLAAHNDSVPGPSVYRDAKYTGSSHPSWPGFWTKSTPWGFGKLLRWVRDQYGNPPVLITENGYSDPNNNKQDEDRAAYFKGYLREMLLAIRDGCNVFGYTAWSLMDNFEWTLGYSVRFGLYFVDFDHPDRTRTPKLSAAFIRNVTRDRAVPP
ncbi:myrosinase 1-like [Frankliniella occidentalis]|uniref:Myrosinase 1-like n=1 Tax=Frankliniella occidentalis TaxID=133901 RepID=A0A6J1SQ21_FRAOC|nr:myrosinase 1-like [Frankliniella occidentalis]XP_026283359.1 myrosinase 1-like [Frankliniella occidentalis]